MVLASTCSRASLRARSARAQGHASSPVPQGTNCQHNGRSEHRLEAMNLTFIPPTASAAVLGCGSTTPRQCRPAQCFVFTPRSRAPVGPRCPARCACPAALRKRTERACPRAPHLLALTVGVKVTPQTSRLLDPSVYSTVAVGSLLTSPTSLMEKYSQLLSIWLKRVPSGCVYARRTHVGSRPERVTHGACIGTRTPFCRFASGISVRARAVRSRVLHAGRRGCALARRAHLVLERQQRRVGEADEPVHGAAATQAHTALWAARRWPRHQRPGHPVRDLDTTPRPDAARARPAPNGVVVPLQAAATARGAQRSCHTRLTSCR